MSKKSIALHTRRAPSSAIASNAWRWDRVLWVGVTPGMFVTMVDSDGDHSLDEE